MVILDDGGGIPLFNKVTARPAQKCDCRFLMRSNSPAHGRETMNLIIKEQPPVARGFAIQGPKTADKISNVVIQPLCPFYVLPCLLDYFCRLSAKSNI